jgi:hypothetical protein
MKNNKLNDYIIRRLFNNILIFNIKFSLIILNIEDIFIVILF